MKILVVLGTRPEAIKLAPVIAELSQRAEIRVRTCVTGQQRELLDQVLDAFEIRPDYDLGLMSPNQHLADLTGRCCATLRQVLDEEDPSWVVVQGDTTTAFAAALAGFYSGAKVAHVEAGLRSFQKSHPFPEEVNRRLISVLADLHFAPTESSRENLLSEGIKDSAIRVTGNTVIDALQETVRRCSGNWPPIPALAQLDPTRRLILVTGHRRESFGDGLRHICKALWSLAQRGDVEIVYPVHLNPSVQGPVASILSDRPNVHLIDPLPYPAFVGLMARSDLVLTDSGGVQEEAPSLGKPVLVMRDVTERTEALRMGTARLTGVDQQSIVRATAELLDNDDAYRSMATAVNPYGDGRASQRIADSIVQYEVED